MSNTDKMPEDIKAMSFEDALAALDDIVSKLEAGDVSLEVSIDIYARGMHLKKHCEDKLKSAQEKIEKITLDDAGNVAGTVPLDAD